MSVDSPPSSPQSKDTQPPSEIDDYRAVLEEENKLHELRVAALESDENVSDVAGKLLVCIYTLHLLLKSVVMTMLKYLSFFTTFSHQECNFNLRYDKTFSSNCS